MLPATLKTDILVDTHFVASLNKALCCPVRYSHKDVKIEPSQGDGWKITTPYGHIDYRHVTPSPDAPVEDRVNEIWWVESHKAGHGSELVDLMQQHHPAGIIGWGVTTPAGKKLRDRWHAAHPHVTADNSPFEGQFDPSGNNYGEEEGEYDFDDDVPEQYKRASGIRYRV